MRVEDAIGTGAQRAATSEVGRGRGPVTNKRRVVEKQPLVGKGMCEQSPLQVFFDVVGFVLIDIC